MKKVNNLKILLVLTVLILLLSCENTNKKPEEYGITNESALSQKTEDATNFDDSKLGLVIPDLLKFKLNPKYPIYSADEYLKITPVEIRSPDDNNMVLAEMISENEIASYLSTKDTYDSCVAVGIYNIDSNEFIPYASFSESLHMIINITAANKEFFLLETAFDDFQHPSLEILSLKDGTMKKIHDFNDSYFSNTMRNHRQILGDFIYFDDIRRIENNLAVDLYSYNLKTDNKALIMESAQNPMIFEDKLAFITKDEEGLFRLVIDLDNNELLRLNERIISIDADTEFYCTENKYNDDERHATAYALRNLSTDEELFYSETTFGNVAVNEYFVSWYTWITLEPTEPPHVFLRKKNCFLRFNNMSPGESLFYIYGSTGLVWSATFEDGIDDREFYKFELVDP